MKSEINHIQLKLYEDWNTGDDAPMSKFLNHPTKIGCGLKNIKSKNYITQSVDIATFKFKRM